MVTPEYTNVIQRFAAQRILVLGDVVADEYLVGRPHRISREAPVLILHYADSFVLPGGATNAAYNLSTLGARVTVVGLIGDDELGHRLLVALDAVGIDTAGIIVDANRPTSTKTRVLAKGTQEVQQQIVRIDRVDSSDLSSGLRDRMVDQLRRVMGNSDSLLISDYENGVISQELIDACVPGAQARGMQVIVDSHGDLYRFKGVTAATPNQPEAEGTWGRSIRDESDLEEAGRALLDGMQAQGVLITRGSEGIALFERNCPTHMQPVSITDESQVVDPTGAGDTVAAAFTLALGAGASMRTAAWIGNVAGGEVVRRLGAATLTPDELVGALGRTRLPAPD